MDVGSLARRLFFGGFLAAGAIALPSLANAEPNNIPQTATESGGVAPTGIFPKSGLVYTDFPGAMNAISRETWKDLQEIIEMLEQNWNVPSLEITYANEPCPDERFVGGKKVAADEDDPSKKYGVRIGFTDGYALFEVLQDKNGGFAASKLGFYLPNGQELNEFFDRADALHEGGSLEGFAESVEATQKTTGTGSTIAKVKGPVKPLRILVKGDINTEKWRGGIGYPGSTERRDLTESEIGAAQRKYQEVIRILRDGLYEAVQKIKEPKSGFSATRF